MTRLRKIGLPFLTLFMPLLGDAQPQSTANTTSRIDAEAASSPISPALADTTTDTTRLDYDEKAQQAAIKSAVLPGWGQIQNNQLWKAPIVWAGLGFTTYLLIDNNRKYQDFARAYHLRTDGNPNTIDQYDPNSNSELAFSKQGLKEARGTFRRYRTLSFLSIIALYGMNILDAYVFAHLKGFNISDNLSASVNPLNFGKIVGINTLTTGITLKIKP